MKRLRYILVIMLSLLIIYTGVGVAICHCLTCEVACFTCTTSCDSCHESDEESSGTCEGTGMCCVDIYKVNLMKQNPSVSVSAPSMELLCRLLPDFQSALFRDEVMEVPYIVPPNLGNSRHYLTLFSVLLI